MNAKYLSILTLAALLVAALIDLGCKSKPAEQSANSQPTTTTAAQSQSPEEAALEFLLTLPHNGKETYKDIIDQQATLQLWRDKNNRAKNKYSSQTIWSGDVNNDGIIDHLCDIGMYIQKDGFHMNDNGATGNRKWVLLVGKDGGEYEAIFNDDGSSPGVIETESGWCGIDCYSHMSAVYGKIRHMEYDGQRYVEIWRSDICNGDGPKRVEMITCDFPQELLQKILKSQEKIVVKNGWCYKTKQKAGQSQEFLLCIMSADVNGKEVTLSPDGKSSTLFLYSITDGKWKELLATYHNGVIILPTINKDGSWQAVAFKGPRVDHDEINSQVEYSIKVEDKMSPCGKTPEEAALNFLLSLSDHGLSPNKEEKIDPAATLKLWRELIAYQNSGKKDKKCPIYWDGDLNNDGITDYGFGIGQYVLTDGSVEDTDGATTNYSWVMLASKKDGGYQAVYDSCGTLPMLLNTSHNGWRDLMAGARVNTEYHYIGYNTFDGKKYDDGWGGLEHAPEGSITRFGNMDHRAPFPKDLVQKIVTDELSIKNPSEIKVKDGWCYETAPNAKGPKAVAICITSAMVNGKETALSPDGKKPTLFVYFKTDKGWERVFATYHNGLIIPPSVGEDGTCRVMAITEPLNEKKELKSWIAYLIKDGKVTTERPAAK